MKPLVTACAMLALAAPLPEAAGAVPGAVYVYDSSGATTGERLLMTSVLGIVNKTTPELYIGRPLWIQELQSQFPGIQVEYHNTPAWFMSRYRDRFAGYCLYNSSTWNEGTSVAGILSAVMVDTTAEHYATDVGLSRLVDLRGKDAAWVYANYGPQLSRDYLFSQFPDRETLRDFAIYHNGFMFYEPPAVETYYANQNPQSWVFGWGPSEYDFFSRASRHNTFGVAADWLEGASATCQWQVPIPRQSTHTPAGTPTDAGAHYVAFVLSDGDNVQFLTNSYFNDPWFGSPYRGSFDMTWDICPALKDVSPLAMRYYYARASNGPHKDFFVNAGGPGLIYPSQCPDIAGFVAANSAYMATTDLNIISVLDNTFDAAKVDAILADPQVLGMMLKVGNAYKGMNGAIHWYNGKPCVTVKYSLWDGFDTPAGLIAALNSAPHDPLHDQNSYSVVNVHPWSANPLGNVNTIARGVGSHVKVVTLEELIMHLRDNFGAPLGYGLRGEYYDDLNFGGFKLTRVDGNVNFNWSGGSPHPAVGADTFSIRWTGQVEPQYPEEYTFYTTSDDGVRLWVDGQLLIDNWTVHAATENNGKITLAAGRKYDVRLEYYENGGVATITLAWSSLSQPKQIIPASRFTPCSPGGGLPAGWSSQDVGQGWLAGCDTEAGGTYTFTGAGLGMRGSADSFHYVFQSWSYDGEVIMRLADLEVFDANAWAGIMIRGSAVPDAPFMMAAISPENLAIAQWRTAAGAASAESQGWPVALPCWLKVVRVANSVTAMFSQNGQSWTPIATQAISLPRDACVGLAVASGSDADLIQAVADSVQLIAYAPGDFDHDGDVDQSDFGLLQACLTRPLVPVTNPTCQPARLDSDIDVDQADIVVFRRCFSGADVPADPDCAK